MIDLFKEAMKVKTDGLFLVVLGPSGAGKSHFLGTHPGRTLMVYGAGEGHGPGAAVKTAGDKLVAVAWDYSPDRGVLPKNEIMKRLKDVLEPEMLKAAGVKCVAIDSITNLCLDLRQTDLFKQKCLSTTGKHNAFKETEVLIEMLSTVINQLQVLSEYHNIDVVTTMDLQIQSLDTATGIITESKPGLPTFGVGRAIIQQFPDILVLARTGDNRTPMFQNMATVTGKSTDETKQLVKYVEYHPRLRGVKVVPELLEADMTKLLALKGK